jgi:hypothetical protein
MDDEDALGAELGGKIGADDTLDIVTADYAVDFQVATGGDLRIGVAGETLARPEV